MLRRAVPLPALLAAAALALAGCGGDERTTTADGTLAAIADAVDAGDDAAIDRLLCPAARDDGDSMSRIRDGLVELDPAFAGAGWHAEPGPVQPVDPATATAPLTVTRTGWPDVHPPEVSQFLDGSPGPRPVNLLHDGRITLVLQDGHWFGCS